MLKPPCYNAATKTDCPERTLNCKSYCQDWKDYEKARDEEYEKRIAVGNTNYNDHARTQLKLVTLG